ncbi:MAG: hypothetical protein ACXVVK_23260 [Solirubrobacteraceae bacterium]
MSEIHVVTAAIQEMAGRLSGIAPGTGEFHGQVVTHASAAASTPAHEAVSGLMARWATALPQFAEAGERLQAAMHGAARAYATSDAAVAAAAENGERPS